MASRSRGRSGHESPSELLREVVGRVVPDCECEQYLPYARELYASFHHPPQSDFTRRTKLVVQKWFGRGLSGHYLWKIGERLLGRMYSAPGDADVPN